MDSHGILRLEPDKIDPGCDLGAFGVGTVPFDVVGSGFLVAVDESLYSLTLEGRAIISPVDCHPSPGIWNDNDARFSRETSSPVLYHLV